MQILSIQSNTNRNISFTNYAKFHYLPNKRLDYSTETWFLRDDMNWETLVNYFSKKYDTAKKINLINHACSAGLETYTLLMQLIKTLGKESQKFLPIIARDIDNEAIECAKQGCFKLCDEELTNARESLKDIFTENLYIEKDFSAKTRTWQDNEYIATCRKELKENINFEQSDIFNDKELINKDNIILLLRNVWKYLGEYKVSELANFLANNMKPTSLLVIGSYDWLYGINLLLEEYGFKKTPIEHVYEPPDKPVEKNIEKFPLRKCWGERLTKEQLHIYGYRV